jgi:hypothetical protein
LALFFFRVESLKMLSDVCSVLVNDLTEGKDDSPALVGKFIEGVRGYFAEPFDYPKPVLAKLIERAENFLNHPSDATLVRLVLAAKTTQEFYDLPPAYYDRIMINRPELAIDEEGNMTVKYSEQPYQPPPEPTEKQIEKTRDLLGRMREANEKEPEQ